MENQKRTFTQEEAEKHFLSRGLVKDTATVETRVLSVTPYTKENGEEIHIVNLNLITPYHIEQFQIHAEEGDFTGALNNNMSISVRKQDYLPVRGEIIVVQVDWVTTKQVDDNGNPIKGLFVTSHRPVPASKPQMMTMEMLTGKTAAEPEQDTVIGRRSEAKTQQRTTQRV
jgi:hypothetical protein